MIAIKRLNEHAAVFDFSSEFLLVRLEHTNLVRLLGWCIHEKERILVYELMHKGGLHQFIFGMFSYFFFLEQRRRAACHFIKKTEKPVGTGPSTKKNSTSNRRQGNN
jgi:hypothetical protein